ncbi:MAG: hypothetical protein OXM61_14405, partial [Candidatus Poribacteria bacterium]|nr:hypothetical protein [Candidatus Poribacteria bacterium]
ESHFERLKDERDAYTREEGTVPFHLQRQIKFCESVMQALGYHEREFHRCRACSFFYINFDLFDNEDNQKDHVELSQKARILFQTLATQAFQLGYAMAIFTVVEELKRLQPTTVSFQYSKRFELVEFVTEVYLAALNKYFSPKDETLHRSLIGYIRESRTSIFDANAHGLRGLLAMSISELNERQWRFFRYAILEIVHSSFCWRAAQSKMKEMDNEWALEWYKKAIPTLVGGIISERKKYVTDAVEASVKGREFELLRMRTEAEEKGAGKTHEQIQDSIEKLQKARKEEAKKSTDSHLKASLENIEEKEKMVRRLSDGL